MNDDIKKKVITISGVVAIPRKADGVIIGKNISEGNVKYAMWLTKQDGSTTKANEQYTTRGFDIGSEVGIAYKEEEREYKYTDKVTGEEKEGKAMNRTILWFAEPSDMEEYAVMGKLDDKKAPSTQAGMDAISQLEKDLDKKLEEKDEIDISSIPF